MNRSNVYKILNKNVLIGRAHIVRSWTIYDGRNAKKAIETRI